MLQFFHDMYMGMKTFLAGMRVTGSYLKDSNLKPKETITTIEYDGTASLAKNVKVAERFRGHLSADISKCGGCRNCMRACPVDCIWLDTEKTETNKPRISRFDIDLLKCMYCGQCVGACPTGALSMTKEWWGASFRDDDPANQQGQIRHLGLGYYTPEERAAIERKRLEALEAKKAAAAAAAKKKAEEAAQAAAPATPQPGEPAQPTPPAP
ncbi:MAG: 4Fe-4S binding protein, partial [Planctomycetota bacterium]|nr:4Fe-4S binding protein [Planctomycetota bacterium]